MITSGRHIRGTTFNERNAFISFDKMMSSLEALENVSFGFETNDQGQTIIRVEPIEYFYPEQVILELGAVTDLEKKVDRDQYFSSVTFGYNKWEGQRDQGTLEEFNSERQFHSGITQLDTDARFFSDLIAGSYPIESVRRLQLTITDEDSAFDEDLFIIKVLRTGETPAWKSESNEFLESSTGLLDPDGTYNLRLSPVRCLLRKGRVLSSCFASGTLDTLTFGSGKGKFEITTKLVGGPIVNEGQDIDVDASLGNPLWRAEMYTFNTPLTLEQLKQLLIDPKELVSFEVGTELRYRYIQDVEVDVKQPGKSLSKFTLKRAFRS
jgi:hypothetical protein